MIKKIICKGICLMVCMTALHLTSGAQDDNKLYVGSLAYSTYEKDLKSIFGKFGEVEEVRIIVDRETGRPRGFGFVTMKTVEGAKNALKEADNIFLADRKLVVKPHGTRVKNLTPENTITGQNSSGTSRGYRGRW